MNIPRRHLAVALVAGAVFTTGAGATTAVRVPFDEMVRGAALIVRATVVETHVVVRPARGNAADPGAKKQGAAPRPAPEVGAGADRAGAPISAGVGGRGGPVPFTHLTLRIDETIKGSSPPGSVLHLRMLGGKIGDRIYEVVGLPRFEAGRRYVLFLEPDYERIGNFVVGVDQGFLRIEPDLERGGEILVDSQGRTVTAVEHNALVRRAGPRGGSAPLTVPRLADLVRAVPRWSDPPPSRWSRP